MSATLFTPITVQSDIAITVPAVQFHVNYWFLLIVQLHLNFRRKVFIYIYIYILHFTIILPVVAHFFHAEKDGHTPEEADRGFSQIRIIDLFSLSVATQT